MGMAKYDRSFIPRLSELVKPLYEIIESKKFKWTNREEEYFNEIKGNWSKELHLFIPIKKDKFTSETDAYDIG